MEQQQPQLVLERLSHWAGVHPDRPLFNFYKDDGESLADSYTYAEFEEKTRALARVLLAPHALGGHGMKRGSFAMLVYPPSLDFIVAFVACLRAGIIAVPVFPPDPNQLRKSMFLFRSIQENCGATVALTNTMFSWARKITSFKNFFKRSGSGASWPDMTWVKTDSSSLPTIPLRGLPKLPLPRPEDVSFLQYTSGSTSAPKGVIVTHAALSHNLHVICRSISATEASTEVSWLPQYHDMGLIGSYLGLMYCGATGHYCSPISFLRDPVVWLRMLSKFKATHTQVPNFALSLALRKYRAKKVPPELDLSSVEHIFNAAEPVVAKDCKVFLDAFSDAGLGPTSIVPGYGLAEHTVYVCDGSQTVLCVDAKSVQSSKIQIVSAATLATVSADGPAPGTQHIVSCGILAGAGRNPSIQVVIIDPDTGVQRAELEVGEIWVDSPSKARGYWAMEEKTQQDFFATPADSALQRRRYLRSGDLGFIYQNELFVCGRLKDLIIVRGRNHYPQDLERCVEGVDSLLRPGCTAAFSVSVAGTEQAVLIAEVRNPKKVKDPNDARTRVEKLVDELMRTFGVTPHAIVLIRPRTVPKTTSGKIARTRARRAYLGDPQSEEDRLQVLYHWQQGATHHHEPHEDGDAVMSDSDGASVGSVDESATARPRNDVLLNSPEAQSLMTKLKEEIVLLLPEDSGIQVEDVDARRSLLQLGLDSMLVEQFRNSLETEEAFLLDTEGLEPEMLYLNEMTLETVVELLLDRENTVAWLRDILARQHGLESTDQQEEQNSDVHEEGRSGGGGTKAYHHHRRQSHAVGDVSERATSGDKDSRSSGRSCIIA